ncbi:MAG: hypothetical protein KGZ83_02930 [Sulfuricella sp.]|nr:hypothetical protein [Sulfuricella sp.]
MKARHSILFACLCGLLTASPSWAAWTAVSSSKPGWLVAGQGSTMYGADAGSVYASSDSGKTWQAGAGTTLAANTSLGYFNSRIWVGSAAQGVAYSADSGTSWTASNSGMSNFFTKKIEYPVYTFATLGSNILAGSYLSGDGGATWKRTFNGLPDDPSSCIFGSCSLKYPAISATSTASAFLVGTMAGVYRSNDGVNWTASGLSGNKVGALVTKGTTVYAGVVSGATGLYKSTDGGSNWTLLSSPSGSLTALAVHPSQDNVVFAGDAASGVFKSTDSGATWTTLSDATISGAVAALAVPADQADMLVAATGNGLFRYEAGATTSQGDIIFAEITRVPRDTQIVSASATVTGLSRPAAISITGGEYSVNGREFTAVPGFVVNGAVVRVRVRSSASYDSATSATLTVGQKSAVFKVTTLKLVTLTSITQVLQNAPSGVQVVGGILQVSGTPTVPLLLSPTATSDVIVQLPTGTPVQIQSGTQTLTYTDVIGNSQLSVQPITSTQTGLQVSSGTFNVQSSTTGVVPIGSSGTTSSTLTTGSSCQTNMTIARTGALTSAFVENCRVTYSSGGTVGGSGFAASTGVDVYGGETAELNTTGSLQLVRIGSLSGDKGLPGDPAPLTTGLVIDSGTSVPLLSGNLQRLNSTASLIDVIQSALNTQFGTTTGKATYDATSGVVTYVVNGQTYRFIPLGSPLVQTGSGGSGFQAASAATTASGSFSLAAQGIQITLAGTFGYFDDLNKSVKTFDSAAKLRLRSSGAIQITVLGADYLCAPGSAASGGGATPTNTPGFQINNNGLITFTDSYGALQVLYPTYADFAAAQSTVQAEAAKNSVSLSLTDNGNGTANFVANGTTYKLQPDYLVTAAPSAHATENWWLDGGKIYLPYSDGTAQGMAVVQ